MTGRTGPAFHTRPVWLTSADQRRYQIESLDIGPQPPEMLAVATAGARAVLMQDVWYEQALGSEWTVAYRLHLQNGGTRLVVGEVRIFPSAGPREPFSGKWLADVLGSDAPVPAGGLPARTVKQVTMRGFVPHLERLFRAVRLPLSFAPVMSQRPSRRGRPAKPEAFYGAVAVTYERFYLEGCSRPTSELARTMHLTSGAARRAVAEARRRGFLSSTERGRPGGRASAEARRLMKGSGLQRIATEGVTARPKGPQATASRKKNAQKSPRGNNRA